LSWETLTSTGSQYTNTSTAAFSAALTTSWNFISRVFGSFMGPGNQYGLADGEKRTKPVPGREGEPAAGSSGQSNRPLRDALFRTRNRISR
jgi:hypothetical protein